MPLPVSAYDPAAVSWSVLYHEAEGSLLPVVNPLFSEGCVLSIPYVSVFTVVLLYSPVAVYTAAAESVSSPVTMNVSVQLPLVTGMLSGDDDASVPFVLYEFFLLRVTAVPAVSEAVPDTVSDVPLL